jgi:magnesium chelatase family protein
MLAMVQSCAVVGLDGALVQVEVDLATGLPAFTIVGLPDAAVNEAKERVRAAIRNSGLAFPLKRITVNLAPADIRKEGPSYDLPMAVGVLRAGEQIVFDDHPEGSRCLFLGELGLDGALRHTNGILPMVALARDHGISTVFVPAVDAAEAALVEGMTIIPVENLAALVGHLRGETPIPPAQPLALDLDVEPTLAVDFSAVRGQEHVKRALEVAAAGGHNVMMLCTQSRARRESPSC